MKFRSSIIFAAITLSVCALVLSACTSSSNAGMSGSSVDPATDPAASETNRAMVLRVTDDTALFVDVDTGAIYFPTIPEKALFGPDGKTITPSQLTAGNIVEVTGNGIMLESYPGQYPGISKISVVDSGNPDDVEAYRSEIDRIFAEPDPDEVPGGYMEYRTSNASVSLMLNPYFYEWNSESSPQSTIYDALFTQDGKVVEGASDARISTTVQAIVGFSQTPIEIKIYREPISENPDGTFSRQPGEDRQEQVDIEVENGQTHLEIQPGFAYTIDASFERGSASYAFITRT